jgi:hypothetical protein
MKTAPTLPKFGVDPFERRRARRAVVVLAGVATLLWSVLILVPPIGR